MQVRQFRLPAIVFATLILAGGAAWAIGFELGETKEQLKLGYDVAVTDHKTGRVTVEVTIADYGRLKPIDSVDLMIPNDGEGTGFVDLSVALAVHKVGDKEVARVHLKGELAERAEIQLKTGHLDGKQEPLTWYYHSIRIAEHLKKKEQGKD